MIGRTTMHRFALFLLLLAAPPLSADTESEVRAALDYFAEVWNVDNLDAIDGYYHQDFVFVGNDGVVPRQQHIDGLRDVVLAGGDHGRIGYSQVRVRELGAAHAMAQGRVMLEFDDGSRLESWFVTVYEKTPFGWKALLTRH